MTSPSPTPRRLLIAGRYAARVKLGSGRMGTVYLADDQTTGERVALKIIDRARTGADLDSAREEFRALASLHHPQIARAFDKVTESFQYLVLSWGTIVELISVYKRLRDFEARIHDEAPVGEAPPVVP